MVQEVLAAKEWSTNSKETIGFYRSTKGAITHLVIKRTRTDWQAVKIIADERFSEKDLWSLTRLHERMPKGKKLQLTALTPTRVSIAGVECHPWEAIV